MQFIHVWVVFYLEFSPEIFFSVLPLFIPTSFLSFTSIKKIFKHPYIVFHNKWIMNFHYSLIIILKNIRVYLLWLNEKLKFSQITHQYWNIVNFHFFFFLYNKCTLPQPRWISIAKIHLYLSMLSNVSQ